FFSSRRRHTRFSRDWSSDVCSSDLRGVRASQDSSKPEYKQRVQVLDGLCRDDWLRHITKGYDALSAASAKKFGQTALAGELEGQIGRASCRERGVSAVVGDSVREER